MLCLVLLFVRYLGTYDNYYTLIGEVPWMGQLIYNEKQDCGAVIIDSWHLLSAAHCVEPAIPEYIRSVYMNLIKYLMYLDT